jgi:hypothetical protein
LWRSFPEEEQTGSRAYKQCELELVAEVAEKKQLDMKKKGSAITRDAIASSLVV